MAIALALVSAAMAAPPETRPSFAVSATSLGVEGGRMEAAEFVTALNAGSWCRAAEAPKTRDWKERPEGGLAGEWVSVVLAGFGEQAEAFAFMADQPNGALRLVGHVSYRKTPMPSGAFEWIPPVDRLAAAFRAGYLREPRSDPRAAMSVRAAEWTDPRPIQLASGDIMANDEHVAATLTAAQALPPLEAMLAAAACGQGCSVASAAAESVDLAVRLDYRSFDLRVTRQAGAERTARARLSVSEDAAYGHLVRWLWILLEGRGQVSDFARLGDGPLRLIEADSNRVTIAGGKEPVQYDVRTGIRLKPGKDAKPAPVSAAAGGASGSEKEESGSAWVELVGDALVRPPIEIGDRLLVAGKNNRLLLLNRADRRILKEIRWPTWILDVAVTEGKTPGVICLDLGRRFSFLDGANLQCLRSVVLPARSAGAFFRAARFPVRWAADVAAGGETDGEAAGRNALKPAVLFGDEEGYLYIVPVDGAVGDSRK